MNSVNDAKQEWGQAGRTGAGSFLCTIRQFMPTDDLMWFLSRDGTHMQRAQNNRNKNIYIYIKIYMYCDLCNKKSKAEDRSCLDIMQYCRGQETCMVFIVQSLRFGHCKNFLDADTMANAHEPGSKVQPLGGLGGDTMDELADIGCEWIGKDEAGQLVKWHNIEEQIAVKGGRELLTYSRALLLRLGCQ